MEQDIRDRPTLDHEDVIGLNFIRADGPFHFRRYYRNGLRSHVMEVLWAEDVLREAGGVLQDGVHRFPTARPVKMLRIFRRRFDHFSQALDEIKRLQIIEKYLTTRYMARSDEFIAEYRKAGKKDVLLCGLQEFVRGEELDPWNLSRAGVLPEFIRPLRTDGERSRAQPSADFLRKVQRSVEGFVRGVKTMIMEAGHVPDLAGRGNLLLIPSGDVVLVDINNVSKVSFTDEIYRDDFGYPVCDKSLEALSLLEQHLLCRPPDLAEPCYRHFMDPERRRRVTDLDRSFHENVGGAPPGSRKENDVPSTL